MPLTIGDFARLGGVSTRMLRHYDGLGLLRPQRVDDASGYRYYGASQLSRLNRLMAFKDLGFSLDEIAGLLACDPRTTADQLSRRRAELAAAIDADRHRLAAVDARLSLLADETADTADLAFVEKPLPPLRLVYLSAQVEDAADLEHQVGPLFDQLTAKLAHRGIATSLPSYAWYETRGDAMHFGVGFTTSADRTGRAVETQDLPRQLRALTVVHHGEIARIPSTWQALAREAEARGLIAAGPGREVYHELPADRPKDWVTEVQLPVSSEPEQWT
ncbi:MAG: MerR family transcriptional regulator [Microlunatus sp.]|nr:MerR family transcriptional regulator [Microlunatus sp.]